MASSKAKKRLNRLLRMSGRTVRSDNNAAQHAQSRRFELDTRKGGMEELEAVAGRTIHELQGQEDDLAKRLGFFA